MADRQERKTGRSRLPATIAVVLLILAGLYVVVFTPGRTQPDQPGVERLD